MSLVPIVTPRLQLRALEPSDTAAVFDILGDEATTAMVSWRQPTLATTAGWIDRRVRDEERHGLSMWAVERRGAH
jgi:RimJ/RimL family protein N-acetyltransferase